MNYEELQIIDESVINGNRDQAFDQIMEYGYDQFFKDYKIYLQEIEEDYSNTLEKYSDMVDLFIARIDL